MQSYADFVAEFFEGGPEGLQKQDRLLGKLYVFLEKRGYVPVLARDLRVLVYKGSTEEWIESYLFRLYAEGYIGLEWYETATGEKRFKVERFSEPKPTTLKRVANHVSAVQAAALIDEVRRRVYESRAEEVASIENWLSDLPESQHLPRLLESHRVRLAEFCDESDPASFYDVDHPDYLAKKIQTATVYPGQCFIPSTYSDAFASDLPGEPTEGWIVSALKERFQMRLTLDCLKEKIDGAESSSQLPKKEYKNDARVLAQFYLSQFGERPINSKNAREFAENWGVKGTGQKLKSTFEFFEGQRLRMADNKKSDNSKRETFRQAIEILENCTSPSKEKALESERGERGF